MGMRMVNSPGRECQPVELRKSKRKKRAGREWVWRIVVASIGRKAEKYGLARSRAADLLTLCDRLPLQ